MSRLFASLVASSLCVITVWCSAVTATAADDDDFRLNDGEIRLDGKLHVANAAQRTCTLEATAFTLPNGKSCRLAHPRTKIIVVDDKTLLHVRGDAARTVTLAQLKHGALAVVVGKDLGSGQSLPAREIAVWDQVRDGRYELRAADAVAKAVATP